MTNYFYFPKSDFEKYDKFDRYDLGGYDCRITIRFPVVLGAIFEHIIDKVKGRTVNLYSKADGGKAYATVKLDTKNSVQRVIVSDIVYNYSRFIHDIFSEFNSLCDRRKHVAVYGRLNEMFREKISYQDIVSKSVVMNISVRGILSMGSKYNIKVMSVNFLFNYIFAKYLLDYGESKYGLTDEDMDMVYEVYSLYLEPYFNDRVELIKEAVELMKRGKVRRSPEYIVLSYLRKNEVIDVDLPIDLMNIMVENGWLNPAYYIRKACYTLWKRGIIIGEEGEYTFLDSEGRIKMPRRFKLKR